LPAHRGDVAVLQQKDRDAVDANPTSRTRKPLGKRKDDDHDMTSSSPHDATAHVVPRPIDPLLRPIAAFFAHNLAGAALLLGAAVVALVWAASPWGNLYHDLLHTHMALIVGDFVLDKTVHDWINDGLMGVFFFVVGLELKREVGEGELSSLGKAALPVVCALGGMLVPAGIYAALNAGTPNISGWGIPMATDIAFALGVLALLGKRVSPALKLFLTAVAVADDLGAITVIAIFYTENVSLLALAMGAGLTLVSLLMNLLGVRSHLAYLLVGLTVWLCFLESGVHATLAAVLVAFTILARTRLDSQGMARSLDRLVKDYSALPLPPGYGLLKPYEQDVLHTIEEVVERGTAPLQRLEHRLLPVVTFVVLPLFAFANAGVTMTGSVIELASNTVFLGVLLGLVLGKPLGIALAAWLAVRSGLAHLPAGMTCADVLALGFLAGIGFTMSLFVGQLAFTDHALVDAAKLGTLCASAIAGSVGFALLRRVTAKRLVAA
jgi:NhaA family Na+:H+ antiporter